MVKLRPVNYFNNNRLAADSFTKLVNELEKEIMNYANFLRA